MAKVSKVVKSNGDVIIDISQDTVEPNNLLEGATAHGSDGEPVRGAVNLNDYLLRAGDEMSGTLTMKATSNSTYANVDLKSTAIDRDGANPSSAITSNSALLMLDKDGNRLARIVTQRQTDGTQRLYLTAYNENNNTESSNTLRLDIAKDGTASYSVTNPAAFRSAIGAAASNHTHSYLPLSGGTLTGDVIFEDGKGIKGNYTNNKITFDDSGRGKIHFGSDDGVDGAYYDLYVNKTGKVVYIDIGSADSATSKDLQIHLEHDYLNGTFVHGDKLKVDCDVLKLGSLSSFSETNLVVDSSGTVGKATSSRDVKHDINYVDETEQYHNAIMQMKPATFIYNADKEQVPKLGMIAEDVANVCPIAGIADISGKVENYDDRAVIAMLVMEVQRLNKEIEKLKKG